MEGEGNTRKSLLRSTHGDVLFAPPDGSSEWRKEYEWMDVVIYPDDKIALRSFHGKYLSDQGNGTLIWNKDFVRESELWDLERFSDGKISLKGVSHKYISAQPEGLVSCDKDKVTEWERFEWLTVYTNPDTKSKAKKNGSGGHRERSGSTSSTSSSGSSTSSPSDHGKNIFRSRTLGLKPAGEPVHFHVQVRRKWTGSPAGLSPSVLD